jgi:hypothetical protein
LVENIRKKWHIIKWVLSKSGTEISQKILINLCYDYKLSLIKWAYSVYPHLFTPMLLSNSLREACIRGQVKVARWVYQMYIKCGSGYYQSTCDAVPDLFRTACGQGEYKIVKWLYNKSLEEGNEINLHADNECVFRLACERGHRQIVEWLYDISGYTINIHAENDYAFRYSLFHSDREIAKWLWDIDISSRMRTLATKCGCSFFYSFKRKTFT